MKRALVILGLCACGGSKPAPPAPPPPAPVASEPAPPPPPAPAPPPAAEPPPAPPATPPKMVVRDHLHDEDGPIAGMPGWTNKRSVDANACGGTKVVISRGRRKLDADQQALAKVYDVQFPTKLNFDPANPKAKEDSTKRFNDYVENLKKVSLEANERYKKVATDDKADPAARAAGAARIAQVSFRFAAVLARAPIPADMHKGEFAKDQLEAYCSMMEEVAEPLAQSGEQAIAKACERSTDGWWASLCPPKA